MGEKTCAIGVNPTGVDKPAKLFHTSSTLLGILTNTQSALSITLANVVETKATAIPVDNVVRAAELQDFDGFWNLDADVASLLNWKLGQLKTSKPANG